MFEGEGVAGLALLERVVRQLCRLMTRSRIVGMAGLPTTLGGQPGNTDDLCTNAQEDPLYERGSACVVVCNIVS